MKYRVFLHGGQVTDRIDTYEEPTYLSADSDAASEVATALGVAVEAISVEHRGSLPMPSVTIPPTPHVASANEQDATAISAILAKADGDITAVETKTLLLRLARRLRRDGVI